MAQFVARTGARSPPWIRPFGVQSIILLLAVLVKLTSRGPAFYSQTRLGLNGRPYKIHKLRTMTHDCEKQSGAKWATANDPRVTPLGRFLRKSHLDELPQLLNVLKGEMSLVGPRPERPEFVAHLRQAVQGYERRLHLKPGLTGLAQIYKGPDEITDDVRKKMRYDLLYMKNSSVYTDMKIVLATIPFSLGLPFTKPPARYSEASLVKELEKRGIGRPSTYASIISTIQDRGYVRVESRRFYAEKMGDIVTDRLNESFTNLMDYNFTAQMEERLDEIAEGKLDWKQVLNEFYKDFSKKLETAESEGKGMRRLTREHCDELISIPMAGTVSSLNVSVATGICLFEAVRQRGGGA